MELSFTIFLAVCGLVLFGLLVRMFLSFHDDNYRDKLRKEFELERRLSDLERRTYR